MRWYLRAPIARDLGERVGEFLDAGRTLRPTVVFEDQNVRLVAGQKHPHVGDTLGILVATGIAEAPLDESIGTFKNDVPEPAAGWIDSEYPQSGEKCLVHASVDFGGRLRDGSRIMRANDAKTASSPVRGVEGLRVNFGAGLIEDAGEELARRDAVDRFEREDGPNIWQARKHLVSGDLRSALAAEQSGNVVLAKSPSPTLATQIIVEVVLGHERKSNGNPFAGVPSSWGHGALAKRRKNVPGTARLWGVPADGEEKAKRSTGIPGGSP